MVEVGDAAALYIAGLGDVAGFFLNDWKELPFKHGSPDGYVFQFGWVNGVGVFFEDGEVSDFSWANAAEFILFAP